MQDEASIEGRGMKKLIAGNWKMNGVSAALAEIDAVLTGLKAAHSNADILICPPATLIRPMADKAAGSVLKVGGQTCHSKESGAHTGDISAAMLVDAGASYVIVGHSERRADHDESDEIVASQAAAAISARLVPIICCGESLQQRETGETNDVILAQLAKSIPEAAQDAAFVVAYEPIWAIGTGLNGVT